MNRRALVLIVLGTFALAGCPNQEQHESIELTNEGVEKYQNQSWDLAIQKFKDATGKWKQNHTAWYSMGEVYAKQGNWDDAASAYQEATKHNSDDAMYNMRLGQARYESAKAKATDKETNTVGNLGDLSQAQQALEKSIEQNGDLFRAHHYLGLIYREQGKPKKAAESFTRAAQLNPTWGKPFIELGELYYRWDRFDEAIRVLSQGENHVLDPELKTDVYYNLGLAYDYKARLTPAEEKNFLDKAIEAYSAALDARKDNAEAKLMRGLAYARKGDKSKAEADLNEYIKRGSGNAFDKQEATKALYSLGDTGGGNPLP